MTARLDGPDGSGSAEWARRIARTPLVRSSRQWVRCLLETPRVRSAQRRLEDTVIRRLALGALVERTGNFAHVQWLGKPIWQNVTDAWLIQETLVDRDVDLVIECGTNRGGSAYYMGTIFDLLGRGNVISIDIEARAEVDHPRVQFLIGDSTSDEVLEVIRARASELSHKHVLVMLDSDHSRDHVARELDRYAEFVGVGDYILVQDGSIDELWRWRASRPGPLPAIESFVARDGRFEVDEERSGRYLVSHSPKGWLRRVR